MPCAPRRRATCSRAEPMPSTSSTGPSTVSPPPALPAPDIVRPMELHPDLKAAIDAGVHGHLVTIGRDGRPQVSVIWLGRDGDELVVAHLGAGQKIRNIEHDD